MYLHALPALSSPWRGCMHEVQQARIDGCSLPVGWWPHMAEAMSTCSSSSRTCAHDYTHAARADPSALALSLAMHARRRAAACPACLQVQKEVDAINELFTIARDEIEYAQEESETVSGHSSRPGPACLPLHAHTLRGCRTRAGGLIRCPPPHTTTTHTHTLPL